MKLEIDMCDCDCDWVPFVGTEAWKRGSAALMLDAICVTQIPASSLVAQLVVELAGSWRWLQRRDGLIFFPVETHPRFSLARLTGVTRLLQYDWPRRAGIMCLREVARCVLTAF